MSLVFSDTSGGKGIIQEIERDCGFNPGDISGNATRLREFTAAVNIALDDAWELIFAAGGKWQFDDSNLTDYPIITTNLVAGQRDYTFTEDEDGHLILDIYRVMVADASGVYRVIYPVDQQSDDDVTTLINGQNAQGVPTRYDKTANGFFLDLVPSYSYENGLKVFINREGSYFTTADTTKKPGFAGTLHRYLAVKASSRYASRKSLANANALKAEVIEFEGLSDGRTLGRIQREYGKRERDIKRRIVPMRQNNK